MAIKQVKIRPRTELQSQYQRFWERFNIYSAQDNKFRTEFTPHPYADVRSYQDYSVAVGPYHLCTGISFSKHECKVGVYFRDVDVWDVFYNRHKEDIESQIGNRLIWTRHKTKGSATLIRQLVFNETDSWEMVFQQMISDLLLMKRVFCSIHVYSTNNV